MIGYWFFTPIDCGTEEDQRREKESGREEQSAAFESRI